MTTPDLPAQELPWALTDPNLGELISITPSGDGALICMDSGGTRFGADELDRIAAAVSAAARRARTYRMPEAAPPFSCANCAATDIYHGGHR